MQEFEHDVRNALPGIYQERKRIVQEILNMCEQLDSRFLPNCVKLLLISRSLRRQAAAIRRMEKHLDRTNLACRLKGGS